MIGDRSEIYSSIDRSHLISGIRNKLYAYKKFLQEYPRTNQSCWRSRTSWMAVVSRISVCECGWRVSVRVAATGNTIVTPN